jgi:type I restriction enzyme S subunit
MKNQLPKDWKWVKLGEVCFTTSGGTPSRKESNYFNGNIPWVKSGELGNGLITDTEEKISEEAVKNSSAKIFPKGTLLIALYGATIGKLAFLGVDAATNQAICGIYKNENIDSHYLYNYLFYKKQKLVNQGIGGAQPNISQTILKNLDLPLPPKATQLAIVSKIEELLSEIENGIKSLFTAKEQLKTYRQSVLTWAFEGKLTNSLNYDSNDLHDEHDLNIAAEPEVEYKTKKNHNIQNNQINPSSDKGELPEGWKWVKLYEVSKVSGGLTKNSKRRNLELQLPFLRVANVHFNFLDLGEMHTIGINKNEIERVRLVKDDLLFVEGNGSIEQIGRVALWNGAIENCVHQNHLIKSRFSKQVVPKYALYFFCSKIGRDRIKEQANSTSGLHKLSLGKISKLELPLSSINEQNEIVQEIESRLSVADKMEESITQSLQQAETLKQSILKKAFEGRLI